MRENDVIINNIDEGLHSARFNVRGPVNKSLNDLIKRNMERNYRRWLKKNENQNSKQSDNDDKLRGLGITVIARATRERNINNILSSYSSQTFSHKELIVAIGKDNVNIDSWKQRVKEYENVQIYKVGSNTSLAKCYKFCIDKAKYQHIMPFMENHHYKPNYITALFHIYNTSGENIEKERESFRDEGSEIPGLTVITSTNRPNYIDNIFENYGRQNYDKKEYILVLNKNSMDIDKWRKRAEEYPNVRVHQLDESLSFGECYNFCVEKARYDYIVPMDDDDYYAQNYLLDTICSFLKSGADVVGKTGRYVYFEDENILAANDIINENRFVKHIHGPTLAFKKKLFNEMKFVDYMGIDSVFCKQCVSKGIKLYSTHKYNHAYIRRSRSKDHTWKISVDKFLEWCEMLIKTNNYREYICK